MKKEEKLKLIERVWCNGVIKNKVYNSFGNYWYDGDTCPVCNVGLSHDNADYSAGYNGKTCNGGSPGQQKKVKYCRDDYLKRQRERGARLKKARLLNTAPAQEVIAFIESTKSEFGQSKPMTKRTITKVEGEKVPEGWVYVVRNPDVPSILKIGKTFPDGIPDIMSSARRFGRAELIHKCWFSEAYRSEQSIHKVLRKYNLRVLGYTDCGKELFECSIDIAMSAILAECSDTEDAA